MSHLSPSVFLLWAILTTALGVFYVNHLWHFDRFHCLNLFRYNGAFKRFMTYSYLAAVPLLLTYTVGFAVIKYKEGYVSLPSGSVVPKPYELWTPIHQASYFPLSMMWALSWGSEAVSHLEELCFWLFLIHSGPSPIPWFKSIYFKMWAGGSVAAMILIPVITAVTKNDPLKNEAWLQLAGSSISLIITIGFLPILWVFPSFVQNVKNEGADDEAITRLVKFHDLNITRIAFRFLFVVPIIMLSIDGLQPHTHTLNEKQAWTDLLAMSSSVGCIVQSVITLMIFFPRNVELETKRWLRGPSGKPHRKLLSSKFRKTSKGQGDPSQLGHDRPKYIITDSPAQPNVQLPSAASVAQPNMTNLNVVYEDQTQPSWDPEYSMISLDHQNHWHGASAVGLTDSEANFSGITPMLNPMAHSYTSPINIDPQDFPRRL